MADSAAQIILLMKTISKGDSAEIVSQIIHLYPDSVEQHDNRPTPLMSAAKYGRSAIIRILLDAGSLLDAVDKTGKTALLIASNHGHIDAVSLLMAAGADVNHQDNQG
jgi:ankyrin repeat protein